MQVIERPSAAILPFPPPSQRPSRGLGVSERIQALSWSHAARRHGVRSLQFHEPEPGDDPAVGSFLLIYCNDDIWAAWGVARRGRGYEVWRPGTGATVGLFDSMGNALAAILDVA